LTSTKYFLKTKQKQQRQVQKFNKKQEVARLQQT